MALGEGKTAMAAVAGVDCSSWCRGAGYPRRPSGHTVASLLAAHHPCLLCTDRFWRPARHLCVYQQMVGFRSAAAARQRSPFNSRSGDPQCRRHLSAGDSGRRLPPQGNPDLAAHGRSVAGARDGYLDGGRAAQTIYAVTRILQGANLAARDFRNAVPTGSGGLLVAADYRGCSAADACYGNVNRDPYGRGSDTLRVLGIDRADVLQVDSAREGSCRNGVKAGDRRMSTAHATGLTFSARANGYVSLTKPDVSFLVLMATAAGYYMGARGPIAWLHMIHVIFGTMLIAAGTAALNHYIERESDRHMRRTASRPLPSGLLQPWEALAFGVTLSFAGALYLYVTAGTPAPVRRAASRPSQPFALTPFK